MIPKIIHYCWFGGNPLPELAIKCIESWKKYCPDYEIKEWNESNFDINIIPYVKEAYENKKYAFVSDYARFWILYNYGGLYFDTDVEIIRPLDNIINRGPFMGCEIPLGKFPIAVAPGLGLGVDKGNYIYKSILDIYESLHFINEDGTLNTQTVVYYTTDAFFKNGLKVTSEIQNCNGIFIYPPEYFCPKSYTDGIIRVTQNTFTIHHYSGSWLPPKNLDYNKLRHKFSYLPNCISHILSAIGSSVKYEGFFGACKIFLKSFFK